MKRSLSDAINALFPVKPVIFCNGIKLFIMLGGKISGGKHSAQYDQTSKTETDKMFSPLPVRSTTK